MGRTNGVGRGRRAVLLLSMALQGVPTAAIAEDVEAAEQAAEDAAVEEVQSAGESATEDATPVGEQEAEEDAPAEETDALAEPDLEDVELGTQSVQYSGTCGTCAWEIDSEGALTVRPQDGSSGDLGYSYTCRYYQPWEDYKTEITSAYFEPGIKAGSSIAGLFMGCTNLKSVDISNLDMSATKSMERTFDHCETMTTLVLGDPDTSNVTSMDATFMDCWALESLDVSVLETSSVTDMMGMFTRCKQIRSFDLSGFDTSNVTDMYAMFNGCDALEAVDLSSFDTSNVTDMCAMFSDCPSLVALDLSGFVTSKVTRFSSLAGNCASLREVDISGMEISDGVDADMFSRCSSLERVITDGTADLARVFPYGYDGIAIVNTSVEAKDIASAEVTLSQTSYMYYGTDHCPRVTVTMDGQELAAGVDYDVTYANNVNAGTATVTVTGKDNYTGTASATFEISPAQVSSAKVTLSQTSYAYDGTAKRPGVTVTLGGKTLKSGTDYDVSYRDNVNPGTATATVTLPLKNGQIR